ncbi:MAG: hypothetical protein C0617_03265 [Desulfuromonas sp.]|uniref:PilW family protein n=1 Tax=Desulfuromonas sp. TaxID=892 RepID=UPI000CB23FEE|nr:PilW family protein [Desulfuromonas sp.]PLX85714.1 MAG: hypothetical protein C0617_03265 [Desulfuromonas sp.]
MKAESIQRSAPRGMHGFRRLLAILTCRNDQRGFSLTEMLITVGIFSVIMGGAYGAFITQMKHSTREYNVAGADIELGIVKTLLERDISSTGYGLANDYGGATDGDGDVLNPRAVKGSEGDRFGGSDSLTLMGTALGVNSRQSMGWTYMDAVDPTFAQWSDSRENIEAGDRVIMMQPDTKALLTEGGKWLFKFNYNYADPAAVAVDERITTVDGGTTFSGAEIGTLVYGLYGQGSSDDDDHADLKPYYVVKYYLPDDAGSNDPGVCAPGTRSLLRAESRKADDNDDPLSTPSPLLACVRDFQVTFGLDKDEDGTIDDWDDGGADHANGYSADNLRKRLKQVRVYILVQSGSPDPDYTYPLASVRVGEATIDSGRDVALTAEQRRYRWKLLTLNIAPRNLK